MNKIEKMDNSIEDLLIYCDAKKKKESVYKSIYSRLDQLEKLKVKENDNQI